MVRVVVYIKCFILAWIFCSCSNSIEHLVDGPDKNVVYCLLDPDEETQYVRVGKTFSEARGFSEYYPHADSLVWQENFEIYIEEWNKSGEIESIYEFQPSNGFERDTGYFPSKGLALFESHFYPKRLKTYAIYVHFENEDFITSGKTTICGSAKVIDPISIPGRKINFQSETSYNVRWEPVAEAGSYQYVFDIVYEETLGSEKSIEYLPIESRVFFTLTSSQMIARPISGNRFIHDIIAGVPNVPETIRKIVNVNFEMYVGGEELSLFLYPDLGESSITTTLNDYTNLVNGMGIFSSLSKTTINNLMLSHATLDELAYSDVTRDLGFLDHYGKR